MFFNRKIVNCFDVVDYSISRHLIGHQLIPAGYITPMNSLEEIQVQEIVDGLSCWIVI